MFRSRDVDNGVQPSVSVVTFHGAMMNLVGSHGYCTAPGGGYFPATGPSLRRVLHADKCTDLLVFEDDKNCECEVYLL